MKGSCPKLVLTIGNFDGVHIGHQRILRRVLEDARAIGGTPMAMSFEPHPVKVLSPERGIKLMTPVEEKARIMEAMGIKKLLLVNFNRDFASLEPDEFVRDVLVERLHPVEIIVGHDYAFGKGKKGTTGILRRRGRRYGFRLSVVRNAKINGKVVSSSRCRRYLDAGRVEDAAKLLGRPYMIEGTVIKGAGRGGRLLGYPTANISTPHELIPKEGVYAVKVRFNGDIYNGVANIGENPTFGEGRKSYEVHILGLDENLLGKNLRMYFLARLRGEEKFNSVDGLKAAIARDIQEAGKVFKKKQETDLI